MIEFLPLSYQKLSVAIWLWAYLELFEIDITARVEKVITDYLNIDTATSIGLDWQASKNGLDPWFWDRDWTIQQKKTLLSNYRKIVTESGNKDFINWLFNVFGLNAKLSPISGWQLGITQFPITLGGNVFAYTIKIDATYVSGTQQRLLIEKIKAAFIPDFVTVTITN